MIPKFRLVDKVKKEIWNVESISWDFGVEVDFLHVDAFNDAGDIKTFSRQFELLQSTGLKDVHEVEFFDKDIARDIDSEELGLVEYVDGAFIMKFASGDGADLYDVKDNFEIIGNQYQHPHLLKE